ncbi:MAG: methionine--tRNA ligase [Candidatus Uhrbacteria bacterium]
MSKFYLTTPIYYVNDKPHIGHAYTTLASDAMILWHRMCGDETFLLTGTDENSQKNSEAAARKLGIAHGVITREQVQGYVDEMSALWQRTWDSIGVACSRFIRTTERDHIVAVNKFINTVRDNDDIYLGTYAGWYCVDCEAFLPEKELKGGMCPMHTRAVERIEEKNYFFRLSKYRDRLIKHFEQHPNFVQPVSRRNEILAYIQDHLEDMSISRPIRHWGIPFPGDETQAVYVWFDALTNYLSGVGYGSDDELFAKWWPANVQIIGKDILKFHAALWPAMLMSAGLPLPERVFAHGFFTIDGRKMSKSLHNAVDPILISEKYSTDVLRYFLFREIPFGGDGDFSEQRLRERYASDLQHGIGNLAARTIAMTHKYAGGKAPRARDESMVEMEWEKYDVAMEGIEPHTALDVIESLLRRADRYIDAQKPWVLAKDETKRDQLLRVLGDLLELLRVCAVMYYPIMPNISEQILTALGQAQWKSEPYEELKKWGRIEEGTAIAKLEHLFPPLSS